MSTERGHSKLGASKAARWLACPGSVALCDTLPEAPTTKYAREGSAAHYVAELCLKHGQDAADFVGRVLAGYEDIECTPEMAEAVQVHVDLCRALQAATGAAQTWLEAPFALLDFDADLFGHNDFAAFNAETGVLSVVDYKHGAGVPVSVENNSQLKYYALGALMQIPRGVREVEIIVVQPRTHGEPVKRWRCSPLDLLEYGAELSEGAEKTRQPNAPLCPGKHCQFCPAKVHVACPALKSASDALVLDEFADLKDAPQIVAETDPDNLAELLASIPVVKMWLSAIEQHAFRSAMAGSPPSGWKLVHKGVKRAWADGDLAMRQAARQFKLDESALFTRDPLSPAQFEKVLGDKAAAESFIKPYLKKATPGLDLVPLSDKRAPVSPPSDGDFADLKDTENERD